MHSIFSKISPGWQHDLHIHCNWSQDVIDIGPNPEKYLELSEKYKMHIGFLDHFELLRDSENDWRLNLRTIDNYLEIMDTIKSDYSHITSGLEIDYYSQLENKIGDFMDNYEKQFDFLVGTMHEVDPYYPVTQKDRLKDLINKYGSFERVVDSYFDLYSKMIESKLFSAVAHPDVIYRFCSPEYVLSNAEMIDKRVIELLKPCINKKILIEINISGRYFEIGRSFPSLPVINTLLAEGAQFFVGSDSHTVDSFEERVLDVRKIHHIIEKRHRL